jgi:hypothetical protein
MLCKTTGKQHRAEFDEESSISLTSFTQSRDDGDLAESSIICFCSCVSYEAIAASRYESNSRHIENGKQLFDLQHR